MEFILHTCKTCGGPLEPFGEQYKCPYCGNVYEVAKAEENTQTLRDLLDSAKSERVNNLRRNLYDAVHAPHVSSTEIATICAELRGYLPDDFQANFYKAAVDPDIHRLTEAIRAIDADTIRDNYADMGSVVKFLIRSLRREFHLPLVNLVERTYAVQDPALHEEYMTRIEEEKERVQKGYYETTLPRDVFIIYSGKDMVHVDELVEYLEAQKLKCFVAARNLRHGRGAVENYNAALREAMDNCRAVVFVSTLNSRDFECDALAVELPYLKAQDIRNAPPEYRKDYKSIPDEYKKARVQYMIQQSGAVENVADTIVEEFFEGHEWASSPREVAERVMKELLKKPVRAGATKGTGIGGQTAGGQGEAGGSIGVPPQIKSQMERVTIFLDSGDWKNADLYCERILDTQPKNAEAYVGKLMAAIHVHSREEIPSSEEILELNRNYHQAVQFGSPELRAELEGYCQENYYRLAGRLAKDKNPQDLLKAAQHYAHIKGYKDADARREGCFETIYLSAKKCLEEGSVEKCREAKQFFDLIPSYKDARNLSNACAEIIQNKPIYQNGVKLIKNKKFLDALRQFESISQYKNSSDMIRHCQEAIQRSNRIQECQNQISTQKKELDQFQSSYNSRLQKITTHAESYSSSRRRRVGILLCIAVIIDLFVIFTFILHMNAADKDSEGRSLLICACLLIVEIVFSCIIGANMKGNKWLCCTYCVLSFAGLFFLEYNHVFLYILFVIARVILVIVWLRFAVNENRGIQGQIKLLKSNSGNRLRQIEEKTAELERMTAELDAFLQKVSME